jgi:hypothetical protein
MKPLPDDFIDHLTELTGNELKVWMYYYLRANDDLLCHPSNETIAAKTELSERTVKTCKAALIQKGWLVYTGDYKQPRMAGGAYAVPIMEVRLPWLPDWIAVVRAASTAYDAYQGIFGDPMTVVQKMTHGTVVQNLHSGFGFGFDVGLGLDSVVAVAGAVPHLIIGEEEVRPPTSKEESKSKPEPTPEPKPKATPTPVKGMVMAQAPKVRLAPDGTPWPKDFDSWPKNADRLEWLVAHGYNPKGSKQGRVVEAASQETVKPVARDGKPTATATPLLNPPGSVAPPNGYCRQCGEPDDFCYCQRPGSIEPTAPLDNWDEL